MKVALKYRVINGKMLEFRQKRQLSQVKCGELAGLGRDVWAGIERMDFSRATRESVQKIADMIECDVNEIVPEEFRGRVFRVSGTAYAEIAECQLEHIERSMNRLLLPSPDEVEQPDDNYPTMVREAIGEVLPTLTYREREVIKRRFGIGQEIPRTRNEVAGDFRITPERVRQIEASAIRKLRHPVRAQRLTHLLQKQ